MYEQREIVLVPFPYSDLTAAKQRPALILSNPKLNKSQDRICCLITSQSTIEGLEIKETHLEKGSLPFKSWAKPYRVFTVHEKIIKKSIGKITHLFHKETLASLNEYLA